MQQAGAKALAFNPKEQATMKNRRGAGAHWGSDDVPAEVGELLRGVLPPEGLAEFQTWLAERLSAVRAELAYRDSQPSRERKRAKFQAMAAHVEALREIAALGGLAVSERAMLRHAAHERRAEFHPLMHRLRADLACLEELIAICQRRFDDEQATGGAPPSVTRGLAVEVAKRLRPAAGGKDENAADLTEKILIACQVPVPTRSTIERMLRAG